MLLNLARHVKRVERMPARVAGGIGGRLVSLENMGNNECMISEGHHELMKIIEGAATAVRFFDGRHSGDLTEEQQEERAIAWASANLFSANPVRKRLAETMLGWVRAL